MYEINFSAAYLTGRQTKVRRYDHGLVKEEFRDLYTGLSSDHLHTEEQSVYALPANRLINQSINQLWIQLLV